MLAENKSLTHKKMLDFIFKQHSPFLAEGKNLLVEEFGREYGTYFSILELIASGKQHAAKSNRFWKSTVGHIWSSWKMNTP